MGFIDPILTSSELSLENLGYILGYRPNTILEIIIFISYLYFKFEAAPGTIITKLFLIAFLLRCSRIDFAISARDILQTHTAL